MEKVVVLFCNVCGCKKAEGAHSSPHTTHTHILRATSLLGYSVWTCFVSSGQFHTCRLLARGMVSFILLFSPYTVPHYILQQHMPFISFYFLSSRLLLTFLFLPPTMPGASVFRTWARREVRYFGVGLFKRMPRICGHAMWIAIHGTYSLYTTACSLLQRLLVSLVLWLKKWHFRWGQHASFLPFPSPTPAFSTCLLPALVLAYRTWLGRTGLEFCGARGSSSFSPPVLLHVSFFSQQLMCSILSKHVCMPSPILILPPLA